MRQADLGFATRNRVRITILIVLATVNYWIATVVAAVVTVVTIIVGVFLEGGDVPASGDAIKILGLIVLGALGLAVVVGTIVALFRLPFLRSRLERRVLRETQARVVPPDEYPQVRNLLEGLAIAAGIPVPRFAIVDERAPNSFSVGTRPQTSIVAITTGLLDVLTRSELEAVLAYEVTRIGDWDVALSSWTVALTGGAISAVDGGEEPGLLMSVFGWLPRTFAQWLQTWAVKDLARQRDRSAIGFTRHPLALLRALEKLDADPSQVGRVTRATAPLWIEFPTRVVDATWFSRRLVRALALEPRIVALRDMAGARAPHVDASVNETTPGGPHG